MRVLISGAGIAGLTVAYWLKRYGFVPTIVERASVLSTEGYKIDVRGSALQVLHRMGIYNTVAAQSTDMQKASLVDKDGNILNELTGNAFGNRVSEDVEIIRSALSQILLDQIPDVEIIFGDSIEEITQDSNEVQVKFKKTEARQFDLVIGADGTHSNTRKLVFGEEKLFTRDLGLYLCGFSVPNYLNLDRAEIQYSELGKMAVLWNCRGQSNMKACFAFASSTPVDLDNTTQQQELLKTMYKDINWEVPKLLNIMPEASDFYFDTASLINMDHWSLGRVVLIGDAAYCSTPLSGQGTSMALIGAHILAGELAQASGSYKTAFQQYEQALRPFVKVNQDLGLKVAKMVKSQENNGLLSRIVNQLMKILPARLSGALIEYFIYLSTKRVNQAANFVTLKDY